MQTGQHHESLRAPRRHGEALLHPAWPLLPQVLQQNLELLQAHDFRFAADNRAAQIRFAARREMLRQAREYSGQYREDLPDIVGSRSTRILCTGHQPELFHAGVWFKNFVLAELADRLDACAVHLIIDNDVCKSTQIRVPTGRANRLQLDWMPFDRSNNLPLEERPIADATVFAAFGERVANTLRPLIDQPLIRGSWPLAVEAGRRTDRLGLALAQMRHRVEASCGLQTLELPLSVICDTEPFCGLWSIFSYARNRFFRFTIAH